MCVCVCEGGETVREMSHLLEVVLLDFEPVTFTRLVDTLGVLEHKTLHTHTHTNRYASKKRGAKVVSA